MPFKTALLPNNQRLIDRLQCIDDCRTAYKASQLPGLILEVNPGGSRMWRIRYRVRRGARRQFRTFKIGDARSITLGMAIEKAKEVLAAVQLTDADPQAERTAPAGREVNELFQLWLHQHAKRNKRSWPRDVELWERHIGPSVGTKVAGDLSRLEVATMLDRIADRAPRQADIAAALLSSIYNWGIATGRVENNPAFKQPKRANMLPVERVLTTDELRSLWKVLDAKSSQGARAVRIMMLTGCRLSEVFGFECGELNGSVWLVGSGRMKAKRPHLVPVTATLATLFAEALSVGPDAPFNPSKLNGKHLSHRGHLAAARAMREAGIEGATPHCIRRTFATGLARLGVDDGLIGRILSHSAGKQTVTGRHYNAHSYEAEKRKALELWETELRQIVGAHS